MMSAKRDYYEILGLSKGASDDEIKRAFKREAVKHHPDRNPDDPQASARFKEANEAYQVLSDQRKKEIYDQFGHEGLEGASGLGGGADVFSHMQDLFNEMFSGSGFSGFGGGRSRKGQDLRLGQKLSFREAAFGVKREVQMRVPARCDECMGSGAQKGTKPEKCAYCKGSGQVSTSRGFMMFSQTCPRCKGQGVQIKSPCVNCAGQGQVEKQKKVMVTFPAGIDSGQRLRVPGQGLTPIHGGEPGDLYVDVDVEPDPRFERDGAELMLRLTIPFVDAALGAECRIPRLDETDLEATTQLSVPPGTQPGSVIKVGGAGVFRLNSKQRGDLNVFIQIDVPKKLSSRAKELLHDLKLELER